jgi:hypothetical protein
MKCRGRYNCCVCGDEHMTLVAGGPLLGWQIP